MNPDKLKIFKKEFDKSKNGGLSKQEKIKLEKLFNQIPKDKQEEFLAKKDTLAEPLKSFVEGLKNKINSLKEDVEKNTLKGGFEELKNSFESSEIAGEFFGLIESYIDLKLEKSFTKIQKDKLKLALLGEIESGFNLSAVGEGLMNKVLKPLKQKIDKLKGGNFDNATDTKDIPGMSEIENSMTEMFEDFGLNLKVKELDAKIKKINEEKDSGKLNNLKGVLSIINPDNVDSISFNTIKVKTNEIVGILDKGKGVADGVKNGLEKLPFGLGNMITGWIKSIIKKGGILGMILGFFFGKEFMDESAGKQKQSLTNLEKFSKTNKFPLNENIKGKEIQKLKPKKLEKFYKYLDSKNIDYSTETFWQELLTGKSKNKKVIEISELLKNKDGKILAEKQDLDDLVKKLNRLEELDSKNEQKQITKNNKEIEKQIQKQKSILKKAKEQEQVLIAISKVKTKQEKQNIIKKNNKVIEEIKIKSEDLIDEIKMKTKLEGLKKQTIDLNIEVKTLETKKQKTFEDYLKEGKIKVGNKLENISIDEQKHILQIGKDNYKIIINTWVGDKLEQISFKNGIIKIIANGVKKIFQLSAVKLLLKELLSKGAINKNIPGKSANLVIKKV